MNAEAYAETVLAPTARIVREYLQAEPWPIQQVVLDAILRHIHYNEPAAPESLVRRYLSGHVRMNLQRAKKATQGDPADVTATFLRLLIKPYHHWANELREATEPATEAQKRFILGRARDLGVVVPDVEKLTKADASLLLDRMQKEGIPTAPTKIEPQPQVVRCDVGWCPHDLPAEEVAASREHHAGHALCSEHQQKWGQLRCSECGTVIDERVRDYSRRHAKTPLCLKHQSERGIVGAAAKAAYDARAPKK